MRMAAAVAVGVLIIELLLLLAFLAGNAWVGGSTWGLIFAALLLLLMVAPWAGDLTVRFDSRGPAGKLSLWWGSFVFRSGADADEIAVRVLGIPWRRRTPRRRPEPEEPPAEPEIAPEAAPEMEGAPETELAAEVEAVEPKRAPFWRRLDEESAEAGVRLGLSGLRAACDLICDAREIKVLVTDVAEKRQVDRLLEGVVGARGLGPVDVVVASRGEDRRMRLRYRIRTLRVLLAGLQVVAEGRPIAFARHAKRLKEAGPTVEERDRQLIGEMVTRREDERDG